MCQSIAEGGRRCAAHTRPKYIEALSYALSNSEPDYSLTHGPSWSGFSPSIISEFMDASLDYASTPSGNEDILKDIEKYRPHSNYAMVVGLLEVAHAKGLERLEEYKSIKRQVEGLTKESNPSTALTVAATLGAEVPAPVGSSVFIVTHITYYDQDRSVDEIGVYPSRELAEEGLVKYIRRYWNRIGGVPWSDAKPDGKSFYLDNPEDQALWDKCEIEYVANTSTEDIIKEFFNRRHMHGDYEIKEMKVG